MATDEDLTKLTLAVKKKRSTARNAVFTRHFKALQCHLGRWREDLVSAHYEKYVTDTLSQVRGDKEWALEVYDCIQADDNVSE